MRLLILLVALWASVAACAAEARLRIGTLEDAELAAPTNRVIREAYRRTGVAVEFQPLPLLRAALLLKEARLDGDFIRTQAFFAWAAAEPRLGRWASDGRPKASAPAASK